MKLKTYLIEYMTENRTEPMAFFFADEKEARKSWARFVNTAINGDILTFKKNGEIIASLKCAPNRGSNF